MYTRGDLKVIYDHLPNFEKTRWAEEARYTSYQGLYRYLRNAPGEMAYTRVIKALQRVVGQQRFEDLMAQFNPSSDLVAATDRLMQEAMKPVNLEEAKKVIEKLEKICALLKNHIEQEKLLNEIRALR